MACHLPLTHGRLPPVFYSDDQLVRFLRNPRTTMVVVTRLRHHSHKGNIQPCRVRCASTASRCRVWRTSAASPCRVRRFAGGFLEGPANNGDRSDQNEAPFTGRPPRALPSPANKRRLPRLATGCQPRHPSLA